MKDGKKPNLKIYYVFLVISADFMKIIRSHGMCLNDIGLFRNFYVCDCVCLLSIYFKKILEGLVFSITEKDVALEVKNIQEILSVVKILY